MLLLGITATVECSYCRKILKAENIAVHEMKCINKPMKCPKCSTDMLLKQWYYHECQKAEGKGN